MTPLKKMKKKKMKKPGLQPRLTHEIITAVATRLDMTDSYSCPSSAVFTTTKSDTSRSSRAAVYAVTKSDTCKNFPSVYAETKSNTNKYSHAVYAATKFKTGRNHKKHKKQSPGTISCARN